MKKNLEQNKGITLIALVITIIILIILAGVSINLILNRNGIVNKAKEGAENYQIAVNEELNMMENIVNEINSNMPGDNEEDTSEPKQALKDKITATNYGDKVNYSVTINGVTLGNGTNGELDWWKILYKDPNTNEVIMIYGDYIPNATDLSKTAGLSQKTGDFEMYGVYVPTNRKEFINKVNDPNKWTRLLDGNVNLAGKATAKGAVDIETLVASWNEKGYQTLYTAKNIGMSDGLDGYYIGTSENTTGTMQKADDEAYNDTLYFPYKTSKDNCNGYWLASPSARSTNHITFVGRTGYFSYEIYSASSCFGIRPIVSLSESVLTSGQDASGAWNIE